MTTQRTDTRPAWREILNGQTLLEETDWFSRYAVPVDELPGVARKLIVHASARFADMFVDTDGAAEYVVHTIWALDSDGRYIMLDSAVTGGEYPSLSDVQPAAFVEECEIYEQFGLRPAGDQPLNRVVVPPYAATDFPRLGRAPAEAPREVHAPHVVGGQAFEFPVGPVRAAGFESLYYGLVTSGEEVVDMYLLHWHKHRGIEWRLRGQAPRSALFTIERVEGLSAVAHGWAFAAAVEDAVGLVVPAGACRVRGVALEMERLYNHAAAIAALCQSTGLSVGQANAEIALERLLRLNAAVFGHRYLFGVVDIGGVTGEFDRRPLAVELPEICADLRRVCRALSTSNSFLDRLEATGLVGQANAVDLGLVGPVARASGVDADTRRDYLQPVYTDTRPRVAVREAGDVLARYQVFLGEMDESERLIGELLAGAQVQPEAAAVPTRAGCGLGWAESARGEALCWVRLDESGRIGRARLRPAAVRNWRAFDDAARSQNVFTDIPIIEASFWLTAAGMAR